ncbi:uncharacterized protein CLUP02_13766 [Colletotrichum lupini]|uniref:Uncharacterized protein n=1 Tax=Colletotrichum lupini TaxID=145971 RepID=A0A9Q8T326_9PEZI|nr:uncharacterized protein CLUP02_13766 [Colletotrichum lupini]KAK1704252.1 hypothetical protein BDP67DRAFT_533787 [Colletotrichum lupini]UQC88243.1 hypothetical protein CLUP02_13766 [Colletotrichum lupini]
MNDNGIFPGLPVSQRVRVFRCYLWLFAYLPLASTLTIGRAAFPKLGRTMCSASLSLKNLAPSPHIPTPCAPPLRMTARLLTHGLHAGLLPTASIAGALWLLPVVEAAGGLSCGM